MEIRIYTGGIAATNAYLLGEKILIDAPEGVVDWLDEIEVSPEVLLLTHQHYDHVESAGQLQERGVKIYGYASRNRELTLEDYVAAAGRPIDVASYEVNELLETLFSDETSTEPSLQAGGEEFLLKHVPGHSPDSVVFILGDLVFCGDTVFAGSVGRPDLPGGDGGLLLAGITEKLMTLPEETQLFPGHGPSTTVGREATTNPYLR